MNDAEDRLQDAEKLLLSISNKRAAKVCFEALGKLSRLHSLQFSVKFLKIICIDELDTQSKEVLETISIGIQMLESVPTQIQVKLCFQLLMQSIKTVIRLISLINFFCRVNVFL